MFSKKIFVLRKKASKFNLTHFLQPGLILTDEEFWQEQKRFVLRHLREFGFGRKTMSGLTEDEAAALVETFDKRVGKNGKTGVLIEMSDAFNVNVLNTLWSMLAGIRYNPEEKGLRDLQGLLTELFANIDMVGALFSQFPVLQYLAPEISGYNKFMQIHKELWKFLRVSLIFSNTFRTMYIMKMGIGICYVME